MFEPGDKVRLVGDVEQDDENKTWTVVSYPWKSWHDLYVNIGDEDGRERAVNVENLRKVEGGDGCGGDFCEVKRRKHGSD